MKASIVRSGVFFLIFAGALFGLAHCEIQHNKQQQQLNQALITAVRNNDSHRVHRLLRQGADANTHELPSEQSNVWQLLLSMFGQAGNDRATRTPLRLAAHHKADLESYLFHPSSGYDLPEMLNCIAMIKMLEIAGAKDE